MRGFPERVILSLGAMGWGLAKFKIVHRASSLASKAEEPSVKFGKIAINSNIRGSYVMDVTNIRGALLLEQKPMHLSCFLLQSPTRKKKPSSLSQ